MEGEADYIHNTGPLAPSTPHEADRGDRSATTQNTTLARRHAFTMITGLPEVLFHGPYLDSQDANIVSGNTKEKPLVSGGQTLVMTEYQTKRTSGSSVKSDTEADSKLTRTLTIVTFCVYF